MLREQTVGPIPESMQQGKLAIQVQFAQESGMDIAAWVQKYAGEFGDLVDHDTEIRELLTAGHTDIAAELIRERLHLESKKYDPSSSN